MRADELLKDKRDEILRVAARHGSRNVRVFGSVARGGAGDESDIDLLVELEPGRSLLDHAALLVNVEELLGRKVDVRNRAVDLLAPPSPDPEGGQAPVSKDPRVYHGQILECALRISSSRST